MLAILGATWQVFLTLVYSVDRRLSRLRRCPACEAPGDGACRYCRPVVRR